MPAFRCFFDIVQWLFAGMLPSRDPGHSLHRSPFLDLSDIGYVEVHFAVNALVGSLVVEPSHRSIDTKRCAG